MSHTTKEYDVVNYLEEVFQLRSISLSFIVLEDDCGVNRKKLEKLLFIRNFPLNHRLFIIDSCPDELANYRPDCIIYCRNNTCKKSFANSLALANTDTGCIIIVV